MGLIKTAAKVAVASSVHGRIQRRQQLRWAQQDQQPGVPVQAHSWGAPAGVPASEQPLAPEAAAAPNDTGERLAQLTQLGELRNAGVLTDAEFEQQKARILHQ